MPADQSLSLEQLDLIRRGIALAKEAHQPGEAGKRARKELAELLVDLRAGFRDALGRADYLGSSRGYRTAVAMVYEQSGLTPGERATVRSGVNYHVSKVVRKRIGADGIAKYGLSPVSKDQSRTERYRAARSGE